METKLRITRHLITTVIGTIIMLSSTAMFIIGQFSDKIDFNLITFTPFLLLGWTLLMAKNSILTGITAGLFKLKG
jgi:hypothetical protein